MRAKSSEIGIPMSLFIFLTITQAIVAALLVGVILVQKSEGGGLGTGGSPAGLMSARGAADFMTRLTALLATIFVVLSIVLAALAVKSSGNRISPTEIEEAALASGAVSEAAAFGIPDDKLGQAIVLIGVPSGEAPEDRLRAHFAAELPAFMRPSRIVLLDRFPLGPNGKLDRAALRAILNGEEPR